MPTMQVDAHELSKVKVEYISLVHRPANRLPIRLMKGDNAVLDLDHFNRRQDAARVVKAEAVSKASQAISDATLLLVQAGYKVIPAAGQDDGRADDGDAVDADPTTADDGQNPVGPVKNVSGVTTAPGDNRLDDGSPNAFSPDAPEASIATTGKMKNTTGVSDGATPGDGLCQDVPYSTVTKAEGKKKKPAAPVVPMVDPTPDDTEGVAKGKGKPKKPAPMMKGGTAPAEEDDNPDDMDDPENPATVSDGEETPDENDVGVDTPSVAKSGKAKKSDGDALAAILANMQVMNSNVAALAASVQKMDGQFADLKSTVDGVQSRIIKTDRALAALVPGQARDDHEVRVVKNDTKVFPLIDTGYKTRL
jgi:hypothetical protein